MYVWQQHAVKRFWGKKGAKDASSPMGPLPTPPFLKRPTFCSSVGERKGFMRSLTYREEEGLVKKRLKFLIYTKGGEGRKV